MLSKAHSEVFWHPVWPNDRAGRASHLREEPPLPQCLCRVTRFGYRRLTAMLRRQGWQVNAKRVHRLCRKEGLKVRRTLKKRRAIGESANACHIRRAEFKDHVWCWEARAGRRPMREEEGPARGSLTPIGP